MKKIVYIRSSNIYDDSRATKEIRALLENGYKVVVLGWNRDGEADARCRKQFEKYLSSIKFNFFSVQVDGGIGIKNINLLVFWLKWVKKVVKKIQNIDAIHACNLDAAFSICRYAKKNNIKLIFDIYDYYVDSHNIPFVLYAFIENMEVNIIDNSDLTIICTEERKEQISKAKPKNLIVIHNSPDVPVLDEAEEIYDYVYCGSLFSGRLLKEIFDKYSDHQDVKFCIAGYGEYSSLANALCDKYDNFHYLGALPYSKVILEEKKAKIISAIYEPSIRNHRLCAPNKFYEALALAKPVVVCRGTGIDKIVEKNNIGVVIDYNESDFYEAIRYLQDNDKLRKQMGIRARELYDQEYRWDIMKNRLLEQYNKLL